MTGGLEMNANDYWQVFLETGAPEFYLLYHHARKLENNHVLDGSGISPAGHKL